MCTTAIATIPPPPSLSSAGTGSTTTTELTGIATVGHGTELIMVVVNNSSSTIEI